MVDLISVNNHKIEVFQKGDKGKPVVILPGMGVSFDSWHEVCHRISTTNRVIMIHRPGIGNSEIGYEERHIYQFTNELNELFRKLKIDEKIILVGHSYGGLCVQHFVKRFPEKVCGVVLVDASSVDSYKLDELELSFLEGQTNELLIKEWLKKADQDAEALKDELKPELTDRQKKLPHDAQQRLLEFGVKPEFYRALASELKCWDEDAKSIKKLGTFRNLPLTVIARDPSYQMEIAKAQNIPLWEMEKFESVWRDLILDQLNLSTQSEFIEAKGAGHSVHIDAPDVISLAINKMNNLLQPSK
ncbi:alpha/beta fold hydrolase [Fictibacillus phosphorivorans]|uniref:alpha/beta fold hydrolase n=1 Tax=Fictibacillus phosphorivorans TaxID=1221500 RepID=UPI0007B3029C|nr:alpha/beta hydrolase [Fictibacillus phosphorivorans]